MNTLTKICSTCKKEKPLADFYKQKTGKFGVRAQCKCCVAEYAAKPENKAKKAEYHAKPENKAKKAENNAKPENKAKKAERNAEWYAKPENKAKTAENNAEYNAKPENKAKMAEYYAEYQKERKATDPLFKLRCNIRTLIGNSIKNGGFKKTSKTAKILGCTFEEFYAHLEMQFTPEMNWNNQGSYWDIDHFFPVTMAETEQQVIALNHYKNLRPLEHIANIKKSNIMPYVIEQNTGEIEILLESDREYILNNLEELETFKNNIMLDK